MAPRQVESVEPKGPRLKSCGDMAYETPPNVIAMLTLALQGYV